MLEKIVNDGESSKSGRKIFRLFAKSLLTRCPKSYSRMESESEESAKSKKNDKNEEKKKTDAPGRKTNNNNMNEENKEKPKKKPWKRIRKAALTTCRYIGMGAAHMSPAAVYSHPSYYVDPKHWDKTYSSSCKPKVNPQTPHWTSNIMFYGGW